MCTFKGYWNAGPLGTDANFALTLAFEIFTPEQREDYLARWDAARRERRQPPPPHSFHPPSAPRHVEEN